MPTPSSRSSEMGRGFPPSFFHSRLSTTPAPQGPEQQISDSWLLRFDAQLLQHSPRTQLPVILKVLPELRPVLLQTTTHENVRVVARLFVFHAELVPRVAYHLARAEITLHEVGRQPHNDQRLRRRLA